MKVEMDEGTFESIRSIIDYGELLGEEKDYRESGKPDNHIWPDFLKVKRWWRRTCLLLKRDLPEEEAADVEDTGEYTGN